MGKTKVSKDISTAFLHPYFFPHSCSPFRLLLLSVAGPCLRCERLSELVNSALLSAAVRRHPGGGGYGQHLSSVSRCATSSSSESRAIHRAPPRTRQSSQ